MKQWLIKAHPWLEELQDKSLLSHLETYPRRVFEAVKFAPETSPDEAYIRGKGYMCRSWFDACLQEWVFDSTGGPVTAGDLPAITEGLMLLTELRSLYCSLPERKPNFE